jgi:hypothetical protein
MRILRYAAALVTLLVPTFVVATPMRAGGPLRMQVSPAIARAPALVTVRVSVDASPDNRALQIIASSATFYRSSEIQLDGSRSTPLNVFEFRNLPSGLYEVTSVLVGTHGPRATISQLAKVEPQAGAR